MKTSMALSWCALGALLVCSSALGGQLAPPPGPVTPTMKPLDAIEPRTCVSDLPGDATAVHVISAPGNYYLTKDIVGKQGAHGIRIDAPDVSVDLNGFSLRGVAGSLDGIHFSPPAPATVSIHGCPTWTPVRCGSVVSGWGGDGIHLRNTTRCGLAHVRVVNCGGDGISVESPPNVTEPMGLGIMVVDSSTNGGAGLRTNDAASADKWFWIRDLETRANGAEGVSVTAGQSSKIQIDADGCVSSGNALDGVRVDVDSDTVGRVRFRRCSSSDNGGGGAVFVGGSSCQITTDHTDHDLSRNGQEGLRCDIGLGAGLDMRLVRVVATENQSDQTSITTADQCDVRVEKFQVRQEFGPSSGHRLTTGDNTLVSYLVDCGLTARCGTTGSSLALGNSCVLTYSARGHTRFLNGSHGLDISTGTSCVIQGSLSSSSYSSNGLSGVSGDGVRCVAGPDTTMRFSADRCIFDDNISDGLHCVGDLDRDGRLDLVVCRSSGNGVHGIYSEKASCSVSSSVCSANGGDGLHFDDSTTLGERTLRCESSTFSGNGGAGGRSSKWSAKTSPILMKHCVCSSNGSGGAIYLRGAITADRCVFSDNVGDGLRCEDATVDTDDCSARGNTDDGIDYLDCDSDDDGIDCSENGGYGMRYTGSAASSARASLTNSSSTGNTRGGGRTETVVVCVGYAELAGNFGPGFDCVDSEADCVDVVCTSNTGDGFRCSGGGSLTLSGGSLRSNGGHGLHYVGSTGGGGGGGRVVVYSCSSSLNTLSGMRCVDASCRLSDCSSSSNGSHGFDYVRCVVSSSRCDGRDNNCNGFSVSGSDATLERCDAMDNDCSGFASSEDNTLGLPVSSSMRCVSCTADRNTDRGFLYGACRDGEASMCSASSNGVSGIEVLSSSTHCRIHRCSVRLNGANGIVVGSFGNTVVGCDATAHPVIAYDVPLPGNTFGPQVDEFGVGANCNPDRNLVR